VVKVFAVTEFQGLKHELIDEDVVLSIYLAIQ
jgi:hypothetical protein